MDVHQRLRQLMEQRGWTEYRLAVSSGLSQSTIANLFSRNTIPSIPTLEAICDAFGITLAQFFAEENVYALSPEQQEMFKKWAVLSPEEKEAVDHLIRVMSRSRK